MPKRDGHVPGYLLHKPSGQARVIIDGKHIYLGEYGSPESHEKYARLIAEFSKTSEAKVVDTRKGSQSFPSMRCWSSITTSPSRIT